MTTHKAKGASTWRYSNPTGLPTIYIALLTLFQDIGPYCVNLKIKGGRAVHMAKVRKGRDQKLLPLEICDAQESILLVK